jgi:hypothetical protein
LTVNPKNGKAKVMNMSQQTTLAPHLIGGNFLLTETAPATVFTPEDLTNEQRMMARAAGEFMDKEVLPQTETIEHQEEGLTPRLVRKAGALGFLGMEVPTEFGGLGLNKASACAVEEQLARLGGFGVSCGAHSGIGTLPIVYFGTEEQKRKCLPKLANAEFIGAYALSEANAGSDALSLRTRATLSPDGKHYVLDGTKMWTSNAGWADLFIIFAKVDGEHVTAFIVERNFPGVSVGREEHKLGIKGSSTRRTILDNAQVPVENVLGGIGKGQYIAFNILNMGRFKLGAGNIGGAKEALKVSVRYALERQQFGKPIASFGLIQHKLAEMATRIFAGESAVYRTAGMIDAVLETGEMVDSMPPYLRGVEEFAVECSIIKVACSEILDYVVDEAVQIHGGYGYTEEFPVARAYRDSRINRIFEGTNEINRLFIPTMLMRRAQRGRLALMQAIGKVSKEIVDMNPFDGSANGDELRAAQSLIANAKKLVLLLSGVAYQRFGDGLIEEQEVLACLSDLIIDTYLSESAVLRTLRNIETFQRSNVPTFQHEAMRDMTLAFVNDAVGRMELNARQAFATAAAGDELRGHLGIVRRLLRWQPVNTVALRRRIAQRLCEVGSYTAMVNG